MTDPQEPEHNSDGSHSNDFSGEEDTGSNSASETGGLQQMPVDSNRDTAPGADRDRAAVPVDQSSNSDRSPFSDLSDVSSSNSGSDSGSESGAQPQRHAVGNRATADPTIAMESDSDHFCDEPEQYWYESTSDSDDEAQEYRIPGRYRSAYISTGGITCDKREWDITIRRELINQPIKEIRLLLNEWSMLTKRKKKPTPGMKLAYKRLRDTYRWMELPTIPPSILLPYRLESEKQAALPTWQYQRLGVGPLVHGFLECYHTYTLFLERYPTDSSRYSTKLYLCQAPDSIRNNRLFMMQALHMNTSSLRWAGENVLECLPIVTYAITKNPLCLEYAPDALKINRDFVKLACSIDAEAIQFAHMSVKEDKHFVRPILLKQGSVLKFMPPSIKDDTESVAIAMKEATYCLKYASRRLRDDRRFIRLEVKRDWQTLIYASGRMRNDKHNALIAVRQSPDAIEYIGNKILRECPMILDIAISNSRGICAFYSHIIKKLSKEQVIHALTLQPTSYEELPDHLKTDRDIVNAVLRQDWTMMRTMSGKINLSLADMYTIIQHEDWYYVPEKIGNYDSATLGLPWSSYRDNLNLCVEGIKKDRRIIRQASRMHKGHPRLVYEAMKYYEDIGNGMIDPLKTAPYIWCNMNVLAKNLAIMHDVPTEHNLRSILLFHFIDRFSKEYLTKSIGISRVYRILKKNVDLFIHDGA